MTQEPGPGVPVTSRPSSLAAVLNAAFGLSLATAAEARAWLADGGWERFDAWLSAHRGDQPHSGRRAAPTAQLGTIPDQKRPPGRPLPQASPDVVT